MGILAPRVYPGTVPRLTCALVAAHFVCALAYTSRLSRPSETTAVGFLWLRVRLDYADPGGSPQNLAEYPSSHVGRKFQGGSHFGESAASRGSAAFHFPVPRTKGSGHRDRAGGERNLRESCNPRIHLGP